LISSETFIFELGLFLVVEEGLGRVCFFFSDGDEDFVGPDVFSATFL
jgi:hypothetical protein